MLISSAIFKAYFCFLCHNFGLEFYVVAFVFCIAELFALHGEQEPTRGQKTPLDGW